MGSIGHHGTNGEMYNEVYTTRAVVMYLHISPNNPEEEPLSYVETMKTDCGSQKEWILFKVSLRYLCVVYSTLQCGVFHK